MYIAVFPFLPMKYSLTHKGWYIGELQGASEKLEVETLEFLQKMSKKNAAFLEEHFSVADKGLTIAIAGSHDELLALIEIFVFFTHKRRLDVALSIPNSWCYEDFHCFIYQQVEGAYETLFNRSKFKYSTERIDELIFYPQRVENIIVSNEFGQFPAELQKVSSDDFILFYDAVVSDKRLYNAILFYNKSLKTLISDEERFLFICTSLEILFECSGGRGIQACLKNKITSWFTEGTFRFASKHEVTERLDKILRVAYDFRSSYVHTGEQKTTQPNLITNIIEPHQLSVFLMNIAAQKIAETFIEGKKREGLLLSGLFSRSFLTDSLSFFQISVDEISKKAKEVDPIFTHYIRLQFADIYSLMWRDDDTSKVERSLNNIIGYLYSIFKTVLKVDPAITFLDEVKGGGEVHLEIFKNSDVLFEACIKTDQQTYMEHCCQQVFGCYIEICIYKQMRFALM